MIIGISGKINSGKDTIGTIIQVLSNSPHFTNEAVKSFLNRPIAPGKWEVKKFADKLKDIVCLLIGCTREQLEDREFKEKELGEEWWVYKFYSSKEHRVVIVPYLENKDKYDEIALIKTTPRLLLQLIGTECGRQIIHPNIWVNALMSEYNQGRRLKLMNDTTSIDTFDNWIITDMRFPNELEAVKKRNGITIRVNRKLDRVLTPEEINSGFHPSETALDDAEFDYTIENNGTLEDLIDAVREILTKEKLL